MSNKTKNAPRLKAAVNPSLPESGQGITSSLRSHKTIGRTTTTAAKATPAAKATTVAKNATTKPRAQAPQATKQVPSSRPKLGPGAKVVNNAINGTEIVADFEQSFLVGAEATEKKASSSKDVQRPKRKSGALRPCLYAYLFLPFRIISKEGNLAPAGKFHDDNTLASFHYLVAAGVVSKKAKKITQEVTPLEPGSTLLLHMLKLAEVICCRGRVGV